jgi:dUTP pyrophosphatase
MTFIKKGSAKGSALSNPLEAEIETQLETPLETQLARPTASGIAVGYFLYPRSSTGTKTPLRLANSIGIIDAGYRGNYIAAFDNIRTESFKVERLQRLVQICPPNLTYPLRVELVEDLEQTIRGTGGFGSTGK